MTAEFGSIQTESILFVRYFGNKNSVPLLFWMILVHYLHQVPSTHLAGISVTPKPLRLPSDGLSVRQAVCSRLSMCVGNHSPSLLLALRKYNSMNSSPGPYLGSFLPYASMKTLKKIVSRSTTLSQTSVGSEQLRNKVDTATTAAHSATTLATMPSSNGVSSRTKILKTFHRQKTWPVKVKVKCCAVQSSLVCRQDRALCRTVMSSYCNKFIL